MNITIQGLNFKVSEHTEEFASKKLQRLERYLPNIRDIRLELSFLDSKRGEDLTIAQLTVIHARGALLRTEEKQAGMNQVSIEASISEAVDKMYRRISRFRGKRRDQRKHRGQFSATAEELEVAEDFTEEMEQMLADDPYADFMDEEAEVVRRKTVHVAPMTEMEAIEQMELLGHTFFMFKNADTQGITVLYKRDTGDYGLLIPSE